MPLCVSTTLFNAWGEREEAIFLSHSLSQLIPFLFKFHSSQNVSTAELDVRTRIHAGYINSVKNHFVTSIWRHPPSENNEL